MRKRYRAVFVSDVHMGMPYANVDKLNEMLKDIDCDYLYLNGDILDLHWKGQLKKWNKEFTKLIKTILKKAERGTQITYLRGNHDDFINHLNGLNLFNRINIADEAIYEYSGDKYLVIHGDVFDRYIPKWLYFVGGVAYGIVLLINDLYSRYRKFKKKPPVSISKKIKQNTKFAINYISQFESQIVKLAEVKHYKGVICGHIHKAQIKEFDDILYLNSGDWIDSNTLLVHTYDNRWEILHHEDSRADTNEIII